MPPAQLNMRAHPGASATMPREKKPNRSTYSGRISARIRELRKAKGMTVEELRDALRASGVEIGLSTTYGYENGNHRPDPDTYPALAKVLGCKSVREFLPEK